ncbi:hypothetical protein evm_003370 [Chilo suppressalis]|nr:hypothetical protein evm_003370 [Chilo suppressalis]
MSLLLASGPNLRHCSRGRGPGRQERAPIIRARTAVEGTRQSPNRFEIMVFQRVWDSSCPRVWDRWESGGKTWVIQDLAPEDDDRALEIMVEDFLPDEALCSTSSLKDEPEGVKSISDVWRLYIARRTSLGCYTEVGGQKTLVALNVCYVTCKGQQDNLNIEGERCKNVFGALQFIESKCDSFQYLGVDKYLTAVGLAVLREYRGAKLGARLLAARQPLCRCLGIKATKTVFTGPASQVLAERCGFQTLAQQTFAELADGGLKYPRDNRTIKLMVKKYE